MSFKNRAATTIAAGAASFALAVGLTPAAFAQDSADASSNHELNIPTDSALDMRVVVLDGKPTVMISNGSGSHGTSSDAGNNEGDTSGDATATPAVEPTTTPTLERSPSANAGGMPSESIDDVDKLREHWESIKNDPAFMVGYLENRKDGESFAEYKERLYKSITENEKVERGNDSTGNAIFDTKTGEIRFQLADLLKELGITPKGVDGSEYASAEEENKANLDKLTKLIDEGKVTFDELPEFVEISGENGLTANTEGVEPGSYPVSGVAIDDEGNKTPFSFKIKVEASGSQNEETKPSQTESAEKTTESNAPESETGEPSKEPSAESETSEASEEPSSESETSESSEAPSSESKSDDDKEEQASSNKFYDDAEIRPGSSLTIKPKSDAKDLDDYVFMNAMSDAPWISVNEKGVIDVDMSDGASEGDRDIYVGYVKRSDMAKFNDGDKSVVNLDKFTLKVSKDAKATEKETDATADQGNDKVNAMKKSLADATSKLREGVKSGDNARESSDKKHDGLYDDVKVEIGDSVTVSPNDAKDRVFAAVLFTTEDGSAIAEADNFPIDPMTEELDINDEGEITIAPSGELLKAGDYKASVITSKADNAEKFAKLVENQDLEGIVTAGEVHEFNVSVSGETSKDDNSGDANGNSAVGANQGDTGGNAAPAGNAGGQPAGQPQAQYNPQSDGSLAQTGVSLYTQLGLAASALAIAGLAAVTMRRRGFAQ